MNKELYTGICNMLDTSPNSPEIELATSILETLTVNDENLVYFLALIRKTINYSKDSFPGFSCYSMKNINFSRFLFYKVRNYLDSKYSPELSRIILEKSSNKLNVKRDVDLDLIDIETLLKEINLVNSTVAYDK